MYLVAFEDDKCRLIKTSTEVPRDGRFAEYRWCPLLNADDIFNVVLIVVQFRDEKPALRCQQLQGRRKRSLSVMMRKRRSQAHLLVTFTFAICYRSPVRLSVVCLSVCLLSVTFVRPTQAVQIFGNISTALSTLAIH